MSHPAKKQRRIVPGSQAERLWAASRQEFAARGYAGARVQAIAKRAGCNVALLYRHLGSKDHIYSTLLKDIWQEVSRPVLEMAQARIDDAPFVVASYFDALARDPEGAQILVREWLDGAPFMVRLFEKDGSSLEMVRLAMRQVITTGIDHGTLRPDIDPELAGVSVGALTAFIAAAHPAATIFLQRPVSASDWRDHLLDLFMHGLVRRPGAQTP
jgi:AcrR family transcriptional regulator